ncbi:hypothetical protein PPERSA_06171 [Pseudocohnilembus persalinus]|uniref:EGF-like domain-containing protein n=1 Tax=Pseudocohnilembus persalinus TaxID=266149 RepID=A0A0V0R0D0_PSEPJ|nr:hypothetical protein PPERSA_06171 [Pseudocohnilembus persalinus]|eukprot:KRX07993.1 hypothetical protein PPERSA_06171 [Pseudocohnilembus persalinus]
MYYINPNKGNRLPPYYLEPFQQYEELISGQSLTVTGCDCQKDFYRFDKSSIICNKCMQHATCLGSDQISVDQGYWRESPYSNYMIECKNNQNACQGGLQNFTCAEGYIGALCEKCDNHGKVWDKYYGAAEQYQCSICEYFFSTIKIFIFGVVILSLTIILNYQGIQEVRMKIKEQHLTQMFKNKIQFDLKETNDNELTATFKIFMQYFASISILTQMDIVDLSLFDSAIQNTGSPGKVIGMTVDCYARFIGDGFPTVYLRVIYVFLTFCIYVMGSIIFFRLFKNKIFKTVQKITYKPDEEDEDIVEKNDKNNSNQGSQGVNKQNISNTNYQLQQSQQKQSPKNSPIINSMNNIQKKQNQQKQQSRYLDDEIIDPSPSYSLLLTKTFIFLFIDIQPSYIQIIIDSISCKQIGEKSYLINDTTLECDSSVNQLFQTLQECQQLCEKNQLFCQKVELQNSNLKKSNCVFYLKNSKQIRNQFNQNYRNLQTDCPTGKYANIYYTENSGQIQADCINVIKFEKTGVTCQEYILVYRENGPVYHEICIKCGSNEFNCECDNNKYYNYDNSQCKNCPSDCEQCAFDKFGPNQVYCFECVDNKAGGPECHCQDNYFYYQEFGIKSCKTCQETMGQDYYLDYQQKNQGYVYNSGTINGICKNASTINDFCVKSTDNFDSSSPSVCTQCIGNNRILPDCNCKQEYIYEYSYSDDCVQCDIGQYFSTDRYNDDCSMTNKKNYNQYCKKSNICINCSTLNHYCLTCDNAICLTCDGQNRYTPNCKCLSGHIPDQNDKKNCIKCLDNTYFSDYQYGLRCQGQHNIETYCTSQYICKPCLQINPFCIECQEENNKGVCLKCQGNRVPPDCLCENEYLPEENQSENCLHCDQKSTNYLDSVLFQQKCQPNDYIQCNYDDICKVCTQFHPLCTVCNKDTCLKCQGDRVAPNCKCPKQQIPSSSNENNCIECQIGTYYDNQKYTQFCQGSFPEYDQDCNQNEICINCEEKFQFCEQCTTQQCIKCVGYNRVLPDCGCKEFHVPNHKDTNSNPDNCILCDSTRFYDTQANENCSEMEKYNKDEHCTYIDVCNDITAINPYCSEAFLDDGVPICVNCINSSRVPPDCYCFQNTVPTTGDESVCKSCDSGFFYSQNDDMCLQNQIYECKEEDICLSCKKINPYCDICVEGQCQFCQGNRYAPYCKCQNNMVADKEDSKNCVSCDANQYYNENQDQCRHNLDDGEYNCFQQQLCVDCTFYNIFCTTCDSEKCLTCKGNRLPPFCKCGENLAPESMDQIDICGSCDQGQTYLSERDQCNQQDNDGKYFCLQDTVCESCKFYNQFCTSCNQINGCIECQGNRLPPHCKCNEKYVTSNQSYEICIECSKGYYYDQNRDICRIDLQDKISEIDYINNVNCLESDICINCSSTIDHCNICSKDEEKLQLTCNVCEGDLEPVQQYSTSINSQQLLVIGCNCQSGFYRFDQDQTTCNKCIPHATCLGSDIISVDQGYWRESTNSIDLIECKNNLNACQGGQQNFTCAEGYIGALLQYL